MRNSTEHGEPPAATLPDRASLRRAGVALSGDQRHALAAYLALVVRWNPVAGLVSAADLGRFGHRHLLDSLILTPLLRGLPHPSSQLPPTNPDPVAPLAEPSAGEREGPAPRMKTASAGEREGPAPRMKTPSAGEREGLAPRTKTPSAGERKPPLPIADIGSGAGLPGIPLAIALPELTVTLVDRSEKKVRFLQRVRDELKLPNVEVRCVDAAGLPAGGYDAVVARAVMPMAELWLLVRAALVPGGRLLVLDKMVHARKTPDTALPTDLTGAALRRHWTHLPEFDTWHGVLEVAEADVWRA